jgi:ubiquinone/menaquinone biosynthesis C-methylase UbiE
MSSQVYFEAVAQEWDGMRQGFFSEAVRDSALAKAGVQAGRIAVDVGAGSGFVTEALLKAGAWGIAVDESEAMLNVMRQKFGANAADYRRGSAETLPLSAGEADYAFANMVLHHVERPATAIQEMARILKPGGVLVITDLDHHRFQFLVEEHHDRWMGFARAEVERWFKEAGLRSVDVTDAGCNCCATSACGSCEASVSIFQASGWK